MRTKLASEMNVAPGAQPPTAPQGHSPQEPILISSQPEG